jgi:hypothetical protein
MGTFCIYANGFTFFCFLGDEKTKLKVLAFSFEIIYFENPSSNALQRLQSSGVDTENAYRKPPVIR